jgi:serine/threonine protein kinase
VRGWRSTRPSGPEPGSAFGVYEVEATVAEGGMGKVYRARAPDGSLVALKVIKAELAGDDTFRRRFDREARAASKVSHPHVVPVLDVGEEDGLPFLTQPFLTGGTLEERIISEGTLTVREAVRMCLQVAAGLDALHAAGLIHRDLKPANILLDDEGRAHVTDFGLAKDHQASMLTKPGQAVGSMDYISPEQIRGQPLTAAADVYSLGCVMCQALCGAPPFADRKGLRVLWAHLQDEPPDPCARRDDVPPELSWAVRSALHKEPEQRPPTAMGYARMVQVAARGAERPEGEGTG